MKLLKHDNVTIIMTGDDWRESITDAIGNRICRDIDIRKAFAAEVIRDLATTLPKAIGIHNSIVTKKRLTESLEKAINSVENLSDEIECHGLNARRVLSAATFRLEKKTGVEIKFNYISELLQNIHEQVVTHSVAHRVRSGPQDQMSTIIAKRIAEIYYSHFKRAPTCKRSADEPSSFDKVCSLVTRLLSAKNEPITLKIGYPTRKKACDATKEAARKADRKAAREAAEKAARTREGGTIN